MTLSERVENHRKEILDAERYIWKNPETGYKEWNTSKYLEECFFHFGYEIKRAGDIPGFTAEIDTGIPGPCVLILGELDSLICNGHPESNPETGAVHCCGHNAQAAALVGIAGALSEDGALEGLCGKIRLCAVPAEELIEIEYRNSLIEKGIIKYYGGKGEFLRRGYFDGVDLAFMVHTAAGFAVKNGSVGCRAKKITYKGVSAHAGGSPWNGINALYAANVGISAANALRETFKDSDLIRFHPIITNGGSAVNAIPEICTIEAYVRGKSFEAIENANLKINRALVGAALSLGANVEISDMAGYSPLMNDNGMSELCFEAFKELYPEESFDKIGGFSTGSTDMGDLSVIMPVVHPYCGGAVGASHSKNYYIDNPERACVMSAAWQLKMVEMLLTDNAARARKIMAEYTPLFKSKEEFLSYVDSLALCGDRIVYGENGKATVSWK